MVMLLDMWGGCIKKKKIVKNVKYDQVLFYLIN